MRTTALIIFGVFLAILHVVIILDIVKSIKQRKKYRVYKVIAAYLLLLPASIMAFFFILLPIIYSLGYAFTDYYALEPETTKFIWFDNFIAIAKQFRAKGDIYAAVKNTAIFVVCVVPLQILMALGLALFCNIKKRGSAIFKVCFFAPVVISLTVTSYLWEHILSSGPDGLFNSILAVFGFGPVDYLGGETAILWIVLLSAWQGCGFQMLIFLSALSNVGDDIYEAASLDGANAFDKFFYLTLPALKPTLLYVVITVFIGACRIMIQPMVMRGYMKNVITLSYYMYKEGFDYRWVGYSSAVALLMTIVIGGITLVQRKLLGEKD